MKGTTFFRPSTSKANADRKKKLGTWTYQFETTGAGGARRFVTKGGFPTKKAADDALIEALAEHGKAPAAVVEPSKLTLDRYLRDEWLPVIAASELKPKTVDGYRYLAEAYIIPGLGNVRICDLTPGQLTKLYTTLRASGARRKGKGGVLIGGGLSASTVHRVHVTLSAALGHAVEARLLKASPVTQIPKKSRPKSPKQKYTMTTWTAEECRTFLAAAADHRLSAFYDLALNTGARRGELIALRWKDIDLDSGLVSIAQNAVVIGKDVVVGTPKGNRARTIDIDPPTITMLRAHRRAQLEERLAWGEAWTDTGLVFTREDGAALHPQTVYWHLGQLVKLAGVPAIRTHDLRHTHATLGLAAGVPVKVMQERLGHSSSQITMDLYQHVIPGMGASAAAQIGALLRAQ